MSNAIHAASTLKQEIPDPRRWRMLGLVCVAIVLALTVWFSATAVIPELTQVYRLSPAESAWLTNGVQIGFVIGAVAASFVNLPDLVPVGRLVGLSATIAAIANAVLLIAPDPSIVIAARIVTGIALASVYPPSMKFISTWFKAGRGLALGAVIGALTLGSAAPHLVRAVTAGFDWQAVIIASSLMTFTGGALFLLVAVEGPHPFSKAVFAPRQIGQVVRNRPLMLANLGYFGHMWELYAFWGWFLAYSAAALSSQGYESPSLVSFITFAVIGLGAIGCVGGGYMADRVGRSTTTIWMLAVSGACAALIGFTFDGPFVLFLLIAITWGVAVVGDSAQFSACVTEVADPRYVGTALTLQMGVGFALTVAAIWVTPLVAEWLGSWRWTFLILLPGPIIGIAAMAMLKRHPAARRIASGLG
ncbi:Possible transporter, Major facilitator superfamily (MFS) [Fulvimarina pelagi HTCC2506]|uniref:Possible transporter, Major facilitator superfamily (MFS) n=2 Tax=Fulvimarina pelagi TaxID=217511 RepID=Q0FZU7_9HYPH|nr:MFS transporter [Fulvimarina pelagi]EAU40494.1 Possible transporter, Major facilitator superfamily (MFS) [Fulvimarina pelagi HTCC2506]BAT31520.1 possible transporter, major facilitator superfamily [Fulvimarina pelagi]